ncbi:MAG TPA: phosphodiester glycosidase family protein [Vicinamibacterales bacterium]|nr:phosphodiester glycosidase family protein [Vicinamibacterales bacterium]
MPEPVRSVHRARLPTRRPGIDGVCLLFLLFSLCASVTSCGASDDLGLGTPDVVVTGVLRYQLADPGLLEPPGPIAVQVLRLDPDRIHLRSALAQDEVMGTETVAEIAARHQAIAAVNAGFFLPNGDPAGVLKVDGELVSDTARPRGAVAVRSDVRRRTRLIFDVVTAGVRVRFSTAEGEKSMNVAGIDTVRHRGRLMLFTPKYHEHTDTAARGVELILDGSPLTVRDRRLDAGSSPIPPSGYVLSYGGLDLPEELRAVEIGDEVRIERHFATRHGTSPRLWAEADHVIGGAGLLMNDGRAIDEWEVEDLRPGFTTERHPRTLIGADRAGDIWLLTVDGRNPQISLGMTFAELQRLAVRLKLTDALNLDGGGSTTMVVRDTVVNHPSDSGGPRKVSDALLVFLR